MSARQVIVLAIALVCAIGAVLLIRGMSASRASAPAAPIAAVEEGERTLVIARNVAQGAVIAPSDLEWRTIPKEAVGEAFITSVAAPEALTDYVGAVARRAFSAGEPVVQGALIQPGDQSAFAALVPPGYRAVAVRIRQERAVGGFIQPNDRVDVIMTTTRSGDIRGDAEIVSADVILENVKVLAIGAAARPAEDEGEEGPQPVRGETAVLELTQLDARTLARADTIGQLSLVLRGVEAEPPSFSPPSAQRFAVPALDQGSVGPPPVVVHGFGVAAEVR